MLLPRPKYVDATGNEVAVEASIEWMPREVTVYEVTVDEVLQGAKAVDCPECDGCGLIPWLPWGEIEECIRCKGTGVDYIGV